MSSLQVFKYKWLKKLSKIRIVFTRRLKLVHLLPHESYGFQWLGMVGAFHNSSLTKEIRRWSPGRNLVFPSLPHPASTCDAHILSKDTPPSHCVWTQVHVHSSFPHPNQQRSGVTPRHSIMSAKSQWEEPRGIKVSILIKLVKHGSIGSFGVSVSSEFVDSRHRVVWEKEKGRVRGRNNICFPGSEAFFYWVCHFPFQLTNQWMELIVGQILQLHRIQSGSNCFWLGV